MNDVSLLNKKILLVEDDRTHREIICSILENMGASVIAVFTGEEAISVVKNDIVDIILMDIELPNIDGIETARRIKEMQRNNEVSFTPILAITSNHDEVTKKVCINDVGMNGFIPKSIWRPKWETNIKEQLLSVLAIWEASELRH